MKLRLLVVDDDASSRRLCLAIGQDLGFDCAEAATAEMADESLTSEPPDILLTDLKMPILSGIDLLKKTKTVSPSTEVAFMTGHGSIELALDAVQRGAYDYIEKPFHAERLRQLLQRIAEKERLVAENQFFRERVNNLETRLAQAGVPESRSLEPGNVPTATPGRQETGLFSETSPGLSPTALEDLERMAIRRVFEQTGGDKALTGKMLGISRATLYRKLKRYNIPLRSSQRQLIESA